jgi:hypothetical protein
MAATTLTLITALFLLTSAPTKAMDVDASTLPVLPELPSLRNPEKTAPIARDLAALRKHSTVRTKPLYAFGATAAQTLEEAIDLGFLKNEHPYKPNTALISHFEVGHCVIVPRSDQRFSYGVVTEVVGPDMVEVACGADKHNQHGYFMKIIATNKLFLLPEWLNHTKRDTTTVTNFKRSMKEAAPLPEGLKEEESYERLPAVLAKNTLKNSAS